MMAAAASGRAVRPRRWCRGLSHKRSLALGEYALGLDRGAVGDPVWRVHQCVLAVLALGSEPVDPRL
jgi:protein phosphatase